MFQLLDVLLVDFLDFGFKFFDLHLQICDLPELLPALLIRLLQLV